MYQNAQFPNVIGLIDGTHIHIQRPRDHEDAFINQEKSEGKFAI